MPSSISASRPSKKLKREANDKESLNITKNKGHPSSSRTISFAEKNPKNKQKRRTPTPPPKLTPAHKSSPKAKDPSKYAPKDSLPPKSFKIIAGSYEKLLYGLDGTLELD